EAGVATVIPPYVNTGAIRVLTHVPKILAQRYRRASRLPGRGISNANRKLSTSRLSASPGRAAVFRFRMSTVNPSTLWRSRVYNPSSMRRRFIVPLVLFVLALVVPGTAATRITIATGPWGGVYFLVGTAMAHLLSKYIPGATAIAEPASGSAHSLEFLHRR